MCFSAQPSDDPRACSLLCRRSSYWSLLPSEFRPPLYLLQPTTSALSRSTATALPTPTACTSTFNNTAAQTAPKPHLLMSNACSAVAASSFHMSVAAWQFNPHAHLSRTPTYSSVSSDPWDIVGFILPSIPFSWTHGRTPSPCYTKHGWTWGKSEVPPLPTRRLRDVLTVGIS